MVKKKKKLKKETGRKAPKRNSSLLDFKFLLAKLIFAICPYPSFKYNINELSKLETSLTFCNVTDGAILFIVDFYERSL